MQFWLLNDTHFVWSEAFTYVDDTTLYSRLNLVSDLCLKLELVSELESDLQNTIEWGRK